MSHEHHHHDIPTKEIGELLEIVSAKVPKLVSDLLGTLYSEEAGAKIGKAVGTFYKELVNAGIPAAEALAMTKDYMNQVKSVTSDVMKNGSHTSYSYSSDK
ncbi:hypothetical protein [Paenibacillus thermotolerans]|uniref:hypothetical protein n=1 Tax=Paenibacillus thermotolerans TaxID=3027807 RepID=UPI002368D07A|nr:MULTISPECIES: hypothetical protein [unclassified Paenibacillus]